MAVEDKTYTFTLIIDGPDLQEDERLDALFEAGCDDALFGSRDGLQFADFDREAPSFAHAIASAITEIRKAVPEAHVIRVEPEDFVSLKAIADRVGMTKQYVQMLADGKRGSGGFPSPVRRVDTKTRVWLWTDVADWLERANIGEITVVNLSEAHTVSAFNGLLEVGHHAARLATAEERDELVEFVKQDDELRVLLRS